MGIIIGIDPGVTCGLAAVSRRLEMGEVRYEVVDHNQVDMRLNRSEEHMAAVLCELVWDWCFDSKWDVLGIAVESFILRSDARQQDHTLLAPLRQWNLMKGFWMGKGILMRTVEIGQRKELKKWQDSNWAPGSGIPIYEQQASEAKGLVTDERLKDWGLWIKGKKHSRDAVRHAVVLHRKLNP